MNSHYFWAVKVPNEVKQELVVKLNQVKSHFPFQRWVHPEDYHITLEFLGFAKQEQLHACSEGIEAAIGDMNSFRLHIKGLDIFGQASMPRVFWAAVQYEEKLMQLQQKVHDECTKAKLELDQRKYHPHLTLARKWVGKEPLIKDKLSIYNPFIEPISFQAEQVVLYTVNKDATPKYEPVTTITLKI